MIQRIQTLYMLASALAILSMHFFWLASFAIPEATFELNALGFTCATEGFATDRMGWDIFLLLVVMLVLPLVTIFLYKRRTLQLRLLIYTAILDLAYYALFFYRTAGYKAEVLALTQAGEVTTTYNYIMLFMPALSVFCLLMAMRGVIFDIALLKSLDRLR